MCFHSKLSAFLRDENFLLGMSVGVHGCLLCICVTLRRTGDPLRISRKDNGWTEYNKCN